jgi:hypothetical protein
MTPAAGAWAVSGGSGSHSGGVSIDPVGEFHHRIRPGCTAELSSDLASVHSKAERRTLQHA